jgi:3-oxoacyl-[acyl-carrier-protein] synthase-3
MISITDIHFKLGKKKESNFFIEKEFNIKKNSIFKLTGIKNRFLSSKSETTEKLALDVLKKLSKKDLLDVSHIIGVTNTPSVKFPGIANFVSNAINLENVHCINLNSGCTGYVDALILASDIIHNNKKSKVLIITSDTYTKYIHKKNRNIRPLFSDGSSASIVKFDKKGYKITQKKTKNISGTQQDLMFKGNEIEMNGPAVVAFAIKHVIPEIKKITKNVANIFIHQAGKLVVNLLKSNLSNKFVIPENYAKYGNLVSTSIPVLLKENYLKLKKSKKIIICGFGVGLSMTLIRLEK